MKFLATLLALPAVVLGVSMTYDSVFDNPSGSLATVACSDGPHGLLSRFKTFGDLPNFPNIGGAPAVTGHGSSACGSCWKVTYRATGKSINILAIDTGFSGFNIGLDAMDRLTNDQGRFLGRIDVDAVRVSPAACGMH